jgi:Terminase large subunit, T4likevirus-type, N-terminal
MKWQDHPILTPPTDAELAVMEPEEIIEYHRVHHEAIENARTDPYRYGFRLPHWGKAEEAFAEVDEVLALGGNRIGKTQWGAYCVVKAAFENPDSEIFCFSQNKEVSVRQQQKAIWEWLPVEMRRKQTSVGAYISYSRKNGFTDSSLILPNGSQIIFKYYSQFQDDKTILEGAELGSRNASWVNVGVWLDEYLLGPELINTLRFRLATRDSKMLVTFTPIAGYTEVIKEYLDGARTLETRKAELLNNDIVPYIQRTKKGTASIHYFHSIDNPWSGYQRIKRDLSGATREQILIRAYGVPTKSQATKFPRFNTALNVLPPDEIAEKMKTQDGTIYHVIDPAGSKNWFMCWIWIDVSNTWHVFREYPGIDIGPWAVEKSGKWVPGDGAKGQGFGIPDYVNEIRDSEGDEVIYERLIDPRLGAAKYQTMNGESSIIDDLIDSGIDVIAAPGLDIEDGLQAIISLMAYDPEKPIDSVNRPHFYVSSDCENILDAIANYTGEGGLKEAHKDPIDVLRYAAIAGIEHVDQKTMLVTAHAGGY